MLKPPLLATLLLSACFTPSAIPAQNRAEFPSSVADFKTVISDLRKRIQALEEDRDLLFAETTVLRARLESVQPPATIELDPTSPQNYHKLETEAGPLLISLESVEPHLDGFKVLLGVGNPSTARYPSFTVSAEWGPRRKSGKAYFAWKKNLRSKAFKFVVPLQPATWNPVELLFPATLPADFGYLTISVEVEQVVLLPPPMAR